MKKMLQMIAVLSTILVLVLGISYLNTNTLKAEEEMPTQEVEPENKEEINTTTSKESWSDFLSDTNNDQTVVVDTPEQLTEDQQMINIEASNGIGQSKDVFIEEPEEETKEEEQDNPITYEYKIIHKDCNGNVVSEEAIQSEQPHDDVVVEATGCVIPKKENNPDPRPTVPPTSTTETVVYDSTPAAPWYVYLGGVSLVIIGIYLFVKPVMSKKAVKQI